MNYKKLLNYVGLFVLVTSLAVTLVPHSVKAATDPTQNTLPNLSGVFVNYSTIKLSDGTIYTDNTADSKLNYYTPAGSDQSASNCGTTVIQDFSSDQTSAKLFDMAKISAGSGTPSFCLVAKSPKATVQLNTAKYKDQYVWSSASTIQKSDGSGTVFNQSTTNPNQFAAVDAKCIGVMQVASTDSTQDTTGTITTQNIPFGSCNYPKNVNIAALSSDALLTAASDSSGSGGATCETSGDPLSWIACPVILGLAKAADGIYGTFVKPLLFTRAIDINNKSDQISQSIYKAWSNFRIIGDVFLVIALLVIVFGESIGGGMIDAYTAKKALPRILVAAILINLSIYIVAVLVDITNIIGSGIISLITSQFNGINDAFNLTPNAGGGLGIAAAVTAGAVWAITGIGSLMEVFLTCVLLPGVLILFSVLITILIRRGLIILLVMVSPVAFALYCLPNTEQYFRKWWDTLLKTLLVYPIIAVFFALAKVMSVTIKWGGETSGLAASLADILSIVALLVPLVMIPFAFRIAGGVLGNAHGLISGFKDRAHKMGEGRRQRALGHMHDERTQRRQDAYQAIQRKGSQGGRLRKSAFGLLARGVGGYNIEAATSEARARVSKEVNDTIATGRDEEARGLTVNKRWARKQTGLRWDKTLNNNAGGYISTATGLAATENEERTAQFRTDKDGLTQFKSLGGAWINEADVDAGHRRWGKNTFAQQAALAYEMRKAQTEDENSNLVNNYRAVATGEGGWGNSEQQLMGSWIGASFEHQNQHLAYKYTDQSQAQGAPKTQAKGITGTKGTAFVEEVYQKRGSYGMSQMDAYTIEQLSSVYDTADAATQQKIASIAETFMHDMGAGSEQIGAAGDGADATPRFEPSAPGAPAGRGRQASTQGAAAVAESVRRLAVKTNRYGGGPVPPGVTPAPPQK